MIFIQGGQNHWTHLSHSCDGKSLLLIVHQDFLQSDDFRLVFLVLGFEDFSESALTNLFLTLVFWDFGAVWEIVVFDVLLKRLHLTGGRWTTAATAAAVMKQGWITITTISVFPGFLIRLTRSLQRAKGEPCDMALENFGARPKSLYPNLQLSVFVRKNHLPSFKSFYPILRAFVSEKYL